MLFLLAGTTAHANRLADVKTVFVVVVENTDWADIKNSPDAPYLNQTLLPLASYCEQYYNPPGLHPSLLNYIWLEAGTNLDIPENDTPWVYHQSTTNHLVSLLRSAGISWRTYQEDISGAYIPLDDTNNYAVRHNPFVYFDDVTGTNNPSDAYGIAHIRPYEELAADLAGNTVARYNFLKPNLCHDGHDWCPPFNNPIRQIDDWLEHALPPILESAAYSNSGAIFITWDEGVAADGPIGMIVLSPLARGGGYSNQIHYTHSSALRSFQKIFGVGPLLGDAANATDLDDLFAELAITRLELQTNGSVQLHAAGLIPGRTNVTERSVDLTTWTAISTNVSATGTAIVSDAAGGEWGRRFYRLVQVP